jgi:hypothetical protein
VSQFIHCYAERHYAECHYTGCRYAVCRSAHLFALAFAPSNGEKKLSASTPFFYFSSLFGSLCNILSKASSCSVAVKALTTDHKIKGLNPEAVFLVMCDPFMNEL